MEIHGVILRSMMDYSFLNVPVIELRVSRMLDTRSTAELNLDTHSTTELHSAQVLRFKLFTAWDKHCGS